MSSGRAGGAAALQVGGAAAVAGVLGLLITTFTASSIGAAATAGFTAFWTSTYFVIGALSGIQQEVARAARPASDGPASGDRLEGSAARPLRRFALVLAGFVLVVVLLLGLVWTIPVFGAAVGPVLAAALAVGAVGYALVTVAAGLCYGLAAWTQVAALVVADAVLRAVAIAVVLQFTHDVAVLAWAVAIPFGAALALLWPLVRRGLAAGYAIDVPLGRLGRNAGHAVVGSISTAVVVSGVPLLIVVTAGAVPDAVVGAFVFAVTVVRAPIMVGVQALQSLFVVRFRDPAGRRRAVLAVCAAVVGAGAVILAAATLWGDAVLAGVMGADFAIGAGALAAVVGSSILVGLMFVTGPYAIATGRHRVFAIGWAVAAAVSVVLLATPAPFESRTALALLVGPSAGAVAHVVGLAWTRAAV